jgi:hypothetical protein
MHSLFSFRYDLLVEGCLIVEVKATDSVHPIHKAQLLSYMKLLDIPLGLEHFQSYCAVLVGRSGDRPQRMARKDSEYQSWKCSIINFNEQKLTDAVSRLILPGANLE